MIHHHDFDQKFEEGKRHEDFVRHYLSRFGDVRRVGYDDQRRGIDFELRCRDGRTFQIEVKCDMVAHRTGFAAIEVISSDEPYRDGWAKTSEAQALLYSMPNPNDPYGGVGEVIPLCVISIKRLLPLWRRRFQAKTVTTTRRDGRRYHTTFVLVPLNELRKLRILEPWATTDDMEAAAADD